MRINPSSSDNLSHMEYRRRNNVLCPFSTSAASSNSSIWIFREGSEQCSRFEGLRMQEGSACKNHCKNANMDKEAIPSPGIFRRKPLFQSFSCLHRTTGVISCWLRSPSLNGFASRSHRRQKTTTFLPIGINSTP